LRQNRKIFFLVWLVHILLTAVAGAAVIWANAAAIKSGVQVSQSLHELLQFFLSIMLFPIKPIVGGWLANSDFKWLFIPAVIINSLMWAFVVAIVVKISSDKKG